MATYLHDIPSVHDVNPTFPPVFATLDLNRKIHAGDPIAPEELVHAKGVAMVLKAQLELHDPGDITQVMIEAAESAELRVTAITAAHAAAIYGPVDVSQQLKAISSQLQEINQRLQRVEQAHTLTNNNQIHE